jgi:hypothetical protein
VSARRRLLTATALAAAIVSPSRAGADAGSASRRALVASLDALLARERPGGGWALPPGPDGRPRPSKFLLRVAERVAAPRGWARWDVVVLRRPGTPAAALALLGGHRVTGRGDYLAGARRTGDLLVALQLSSGGWFPEMPVDGTGGTWWFPLLVPGVPLDDDATPGTIRLLLALAEATGEAAYREAAIRGLDLLLRAQLPSGAWPRIWRSRWKRLVRPTYEDLATLNDGATPQAIVTLLAGARALARPDLLAAARRGGDWLVRVRGPAPQAGWASQYDAADRPAAGRPFEPAALASWESRYAVEALLALADATGDARFCAPVPAAVAWLARSALGPGCWARWYALDSNEPLYLTREGMRVPAAAQADALSSWTGDFGIPALLARLGVPPDRPGPASAGGPCAGSAPAAPGPRSTRALIARAETLLAALEPPVGTVCAAAVAVTP